MKHIHHIIPKHLGGTDDPSNLIELTIEEHAEAHRRLYEENGLLEDKLAWLGLSGIMKRKDIIREMQLAPKSEEHKKKISESKTGLPRPDLIGNTYATALKGRKKTKEHQDRINESLNTEEVKIKARASWDSKPIVTCPHCLTKGKKGHNMNRFHFDNCKRKN
jgi:hypothetical protein